MRDLARLEALLFQYGEPLPYEDVARLLGLDETAATRLLDAYETALRDDARGLCLLRSDSACQLATKPETAPLTEQLAQENFGTELTPAVLEVVTIAAYLGPVSRAMIDEIRGVNSSLAVRNAYLRGLLEKKKEKNAYVYAVSPEFLRHLGIGSREDLPDYRAHREKLETLITGNK